MRRHGFRRHVVQPGHDRPLLGGPSPKPVVHVKPKQSALLPHTGHICLAGLLVAPRASRFTHRLTLSAAAHSLRAVAPLLASFSATVSRSCPARGDHFPPSFLSLLTQGCLRPVLVLETVTFTRRPVLTRPSFCPAGSLFDVAGREEPSLVLLAPCRGDLPRVGCGFPSGVRSESPIRGCLSSLGPCVWGC